MKLITITLLALMLTLGATVVCAQTDPSKPEPTEEQKKAKEESEKRGFALLELVINEAQMMRLPENRIRVQISVADLLWASNEGRARSLFSLAADGVGELMRNVDTSEDRRNFNQARSWSQLRQELVLTVARHDAPLAYQFLAATRLLAQPNSDPRNARRFEMENNLEQTLLAQVAALDPKTALQNAEQLLDKGDFPRSLAEVLSQLQHKDKEAATKLEDKLVKKLQSANMLSNVDAASLALSLLQSGPRLSNDAKNSSATNALLAESAYQDLMSTLLDAAMKATPQAAAATQQRARGIRGANRGNQSSGQNPSSQPTDAQMEQANARRVLGGFRGLLPQVDQYLPSRSAALRQKMADLGLGGGSNARASTGQLSSVLQQNNTDGLLAVASSAPPQVQNRIYQQAALKALDEGNADRARQIANDYLQAGQRESVLRTVEFRQLADNSQPTKIEDVRNTLSQLPSDAERLDFLIRLSASMRTKNPELALQLLDEGRQFTNRRASGYQQFDQQLKLAAAYKDLAGARGFEVLEPGIMQLNELLSAAAVLSGFEVNVFRDGEMPIQGGNGLSEMVRRYGQQIGQLSQNDFDRAEALASRFQFTEPRIVAQLAIARTQLGLDSATETDNTFRPRGFSQNSFIRRQD